MELNLTVLAGAKKGTSVPLKKEEFVIGRSSECSLRAGSEAISRRHCLIKRTNEGFVVSDLGSRNGTFLNDEPVKEPRVLAEGDELRIGPLTFRVDAAVPKQPAAAGEPKLTSVAPPAGLKKTKQPPVKDVADVAARIADHGQDENLEDDISRWLIGTEKSTPATSETVNFKIDETKALRLEDMNAAVEQQEVAESSDEEVTSGAEANTDEAGAGSGWSLFGRGKKGKESSARPKPGKLPNRPEKNSAKDSREAATNVLREMTRRR